MAIRNAVVQVFQYETLYELVEVAGLNGGKSLAAIAAGQHPRWGDMGNDNLRREAIDPEWPGANSSGRGDPANHRAEKRTPVHAPKHSTACRRENGLSRGQLGSYADAGVVPKNRSRSSFISS